MYLLELLRLLRDKASTPSRVLGLIGLYLAFAIQPTSPIFEPFLLNHEDLLLPLAGGFIAYWALMEGWGWLVHGEHLPASQRQVRELGIKINTVAGRQLRLSDTIGEAYWESDTTGKLVFSNYANAQLYGTTARELLRTGTAPYIHKGDVQDAYRMFKQAIEGQMGFSLEFDIVDKGITTRTIVVYAWPLFDDEGNFEGHFGSAEEIDRYGDY